MKKVLNILCALLVGCCLLIGCDWIRTKILNEPVIQVDTTEVLGASPKMFYTLDKNLGKSQLDSMILVDNLVGLEDWIPSMVSYNGKAIKQFMFIKSLENDNELIYTVTLTQCDTIFKCTKRVVE